MSVLMGFNDFEWPETVEEQKKDYVINYKGPDHLGIKTRLRKWEYTVLHDGVLVRNVELNKMFKLFVI